MIRVPDDLFRDCVVSMQTVADCMLMVAKLMREGRLIGTSEEDFDLAVRILQQAIAAQTAQKAIWQACLEEDTPERIQ